MYVISHKLFRSVYVSPCIDSTLRQSYVRDMLPQARTNCWICREVLLWEDARLDEFGFPVHKLCHQKLEDEKSRVLPTVVPIKPKPKSN
jgi:hypothetical protein